VLVAGRLDPDQVGALAVKACSRHLFHSRPENGPGGPGRFA
jgi:hypothetical protein